MSATRMTPHASPLSARAATFLLCNLAALAQQAPPEPAITQARVRECLEFLASDELQGRDSPSPGLQKAADYLAERFVRASLKPVRGESMLCGFSLPGQRLDSAALTVWATMAKGDGKQEVELQGDRDVRLLRPAPDSEGADDAASVIGEADGRLARSLTMGGARRATVLVVPESHPMWAAAQGEQRSLSRRIRNSAPVFLVRQESLPTVAQAASDPEHPPSWSIRWRGAAAEPCEVELANVAGLLPGTTRADEFVVVSAHYDHIGVQAPQDGDGICNGADDDASGTTAVTLLAEEFAKGPPCARSIAFVCFAAEEKGLRGSRAFVEDCPLPLGQIAVNLNIEMIGRPAEGKRRMAWITGAEYSDFAAIAGAALRQGGIETTEFAMARQLFAQSDNLSFAQRGIVAHSISAGSLHADYHKPSDEAARIDVEHMTDVIRGLAQAVRAFADRPDAPRWTEEGKAQLERMKPR